MGSCYVLAVFLMVARVCDGTCTGDHNTAGVCSWQGECVNETCMCIEGFVGVNCEHYCTSAKNCSNHGECSNTGICSCHSGFKGDNCSTAVVTCTDSDTCSGHGTCNSDDTCTCNTGYTGNDCGTESVITCTDSVTCSGHGTCNSDDTCTCITGYTGNDCGTSSGAVSMVTSCSLLMVALSMMRLLLLA